MAIHAARGDVRDRGLAAAGEDLIERAARAMPVLLAVRRRFQRERPLAGLRVAARLQVTSGTANLVLALRAAGADVPLCASSPLSTNDAVAAALARAGPRVRLRRGGGGPDRAQAALGHPDGAPFGPGRRAAAVSQVLVAGWAPARRRRDPPAPRPSREGGKPVRAMLLGLPAEATTRGER